MKNHLVAFLIFIAIIDIGLFMGCDLVKKSEYRHLEERMQSLQDRIDTLEAQNESITDAYTTVSQRLYQNENDYVDLKKDISHLEVKSNDLNDDFDKMLQVMTIMRGKKIQAHK